ncbi:hypothetical protein [Rhodanobacter sp. DHB23]|uniref:hypothetical protein n=1 Tax=Rhodanobacter sp. DHB23 TaxID=2775923 RepID=UPI00177E3CAB|nr:hypothetical protein [Rhodanobacter sp. DHB23]MBD8872330.1 hypothetical protein [Rhodanobacter sp. DHB23]
MSFASIKSLQRGHGLPFVIASNILHEQTTLARRHCRAWFTLGGIGLAIVLAGAFALPRPFADTTLRVALAGAGLCTGIGELLARRRAQPRILAAAHAAGAGSARDG